MTDVITYDDIYELLRSEKNSADLEPLDAEYLTKVKDYLLAKRKLLESQKGGMFSGLRERAKIMSEIENVRGALRDLFEKRERKVINRALYTLRTDLKMKDTTHMLKSETELYVALLKILEQSKLACFALISESATEYESSSADAVSAPKIAPITAPATPSPPAAPTFDVTDSPPSEARPEVTDSPPPAPLAEDSQGVPLTFLEAVPELVDAELQRHGPFQEGDTASLPSELASILVAQGKAKTA